MVYRVSPDCRHHVTYGTVFVTFASMDVTLSKQEVTWILPSLTFKR